MDGAFRVGDWRVEPQLNTIADSNRTTHLEPKVMKVLVYLAEHKDQVIGKERLIQAVWSDTFVTDDVLTHAVSELRRAFGDDAKAPRYIQTIPKGGYRLVAVLTRESSPPQAAFAPPTRGSVVAENVDGSRRTRTAPAIAWALLTLVVGGAWLSWRGTRPIPDRVMHLSLNLPQSITLGAGAGHVPAFSISPDGKSVVYSASAEERVRLYHRALDEPEARPLPDTEEGTQPFFSPDGDWVGFKGHNSLKKVSLRGGPAITLCDAPTFRGATWTTRGTIVFTPTFEDGLWQVSERGGRPTPLTTRDRVRGENSHRWPQILPDGRTVLFTIRHGGDFDDAEVAVVDLETGERRTLFTGGTFARYSPTGHLVYGRQTALLAVAFDLARLRVSGSPFPVLGGIVAYQDSGTANFSISQNGSLAYVTHHEGAADRSLVWVDEHGLASPVLAARHGYQGVRVSPDHGRLALSIVDGADPGIWIYDLARGTLSRATPDRGNDHAVWHPDGHIAFTSTRSGPWNLFSQQPDATGEAERLTTSPHWQWPTSWSPDGRLLAYTEVDPTTNPDIWVLERDGGRRHVFVATPARETNAVFAPDGRWLAYVSDESGAREVYVRPYPGPGARWQVSAGGGGQPMWHPSGGTLFYRSGDKMFAVSVATQPRFIAGKPRLLFEGKYWKSFVHHAPEYDVMPGGRFVMIRDSERAASPTEIKIVLNWFDELARRAPLRAN